jgi:hypothetical protein
MVGGPGLRFALEATFLVVLAAAAGFAELSPTTIVIVMGAAWLLVAAIEWLAWRESPRVTRVRELSAQPLVEAPGLEPEPAEPPRRRRFWRRRSEEPAPAEAGGSVLGEDTADLEPLPEEQATARADDGTRT